MIEMWRNGIHSSSEIHIVREVELIHIKVRLRHVQLQQEVAFEGVDVPLLLN